jgi:hypothetical protein
MSFSDSRSGEIGQLVISLCLPRMQTDVQAYNPADPLAVSYLAQIAGARNPTGATTNLVTSIKIPEEAETHVRENDSDHVDDDSAPNSRLPEGITWNKLLHCFSPGA